MCTNSTNGDKMNEMFEYAKFLRRLKEVRDSRNLKQENVADGAKFERTAYGRREKGELQIKVSELIEIANFYKVSPAIFFQDDLTSQAEGNSSSIWRPYIEQLTIILESNHAVYVPAIVSNLAGFTAGIAAEQLSHARGREIADLNVKVKKQDQKIEEQDRKIREQGQQIEQLIAEKGTDFKTPRKRSGSSG